MWMVTRYDDVRAILADDANISSDCFTWSSAEYKDAGLDAAFYGLTVMDPPRHTHIRHLVMGAFASRRAA